MGLIQPCLAGMPSLTFTEVARLRLESISFFLVLFLLSSFVIQRLWNGLRKDMPVLPRLSYGKAVGLVGLWGLLFILVLTMISGARELLTPGAWEKTGLTYQLKKAEPAPANPEAQDIRRKEQLWQLREALWEYARTHDGRFPTSRSEIAADKWLLPDDSGVSYFYVGGKLDRTNPAPLAYEPELYGSPCWVLWTDGELRRMTLDEIIRALPAEKR